MRIPSFIDSERVACGFATAKTIAVQSRRELRVIVPRLSGDRNTGSISNRVGRCRLMIARPRDLRRQPIKLETTTTRQNCGESPGTRYPDRGIGRFLPSAAMFPPTVPSERRRSVNQVQPALDRSARARFVGHFCIPHCPSPSPPCGPDLSKNGCLDFLGIMAVRFFVRPAAS